MGALSIGLVARSPRRPSECPADDACMVIELTSSFVGRHGVPSSVCACSGGFVMGLPPPQTSSVYFLAGTFTVSIAWMTPLLDVMSGWVMVAPSMRSLSPSLVTVAV